MNILNIFFNKIYIITCREDEYRRIHVQRQLDEYNITNIQYQISTPSELLVERKDLSRQDLSLILSHINCVIDATINKYKRILILEDDFRLEYNYEIEFNKIINNLPSDWDFIHLGTANWTKSVFTQKRGQPVNEFVEKYIFAPGSHCVGIKSTCFDFIINNFMNHDLPIDLIYEKILCPKHNAYVSRYSICDALSVPHKLYWPMIPNFDESSFWTSKIRDATKSP